MNLRIGNLQSSALLIVRAVPAPNIYGVKSKVARRILIIGSLPVISDGRSVEERFWSEPHMDSLQRANHEMLGVPLSLG